MNGVDFIALGLVALSVVVGTIRGLTGETGRLCGFAAGALAGYAMTPVWQELAATCIAEESSALSRGILVVVAVVLTAFAVWVLVSRLVKKFLRIVLEQPTDGILGFTFGALRGIAFVLCLLCLASFVLIGTAEDYVFWDSPIGKAAHPIVRSLRAQIGTTKLPFLGEPETATSDGG